MKFIHLPILTIGLFLLCSCSIFNNKQSAPAPGVLNSKPLVQPVGNNWQIIEEAPKLSDERGRLPFQMEQSVQPEVARPVSPDDKRKIEMSR